MPTYVCDDSDAARLGNDPNPDNNASLAAAVAKAKAQSMPKDKIKADEDEVMVAVADAAVEDYEDAGEEWIVWTNPTELMAVSKGLEELDDVQDVYSTMDMTDEVIAALEEE